MVLQAPLAPVAFVLSVVVSVLAFSAILLSLGPVDWSGASLLRVSVAAFLLSVVAEEEALLAVAGE